MRTTIDPGIDRPTIFLLDHIVYSHVQNLGGQPLDLDLSLMLPLQNNGEMRRIFGNNQPEERPDATIFLIGRTLPGVDLSHLKQYKNIVFHGLVPQPELPAYLAQMDVCLNVFRAGALSKDVSPLKFYEYLATGKPVVSTREPLQVEDFRDVVYIAHDADEFLALCDEAAREDAPEKVEKRLAYGEQCSWTERVRQMEDVLYKKGVLHESPEK